MKSIFFLICSYLLNCLGSVWTIVMTTESGWNSLKVIFTKQFFTKATIFCCFDVFSAQPPQIFQAQAKISTTRPVLPDYLSVSYDYELTHLKKVFLSSARHGACQFFSDFVFTRYISTWPSYCVFDLSEVSITKCLLFTSISNAKEIFKLNKPNKSWIKLFFCIGNFPLTYNIIWF